MNGFIPTVSPVVSRRANYELIECDTCRSCLRAKLLVLMSIDFLLGASKNVGVGSKVLVLFLMGL